MSGFQIRVQAAGVLLTGLFGLANAQPAADAQHPLLVDERSRVAVMEYEAWFGPKGVTSSTARQGHGCNRPTWLLWEEARTAPIRP
jgi:hypothetical protein